MIGQTISHYRILEKLGEGGMGVVYKAEDTKLNRTVALKFLPHHLSGDPGAKTRFIQEAHAASVLQHPNICTIHDIDETDDGRLFIVMDCYDGETLQKRIERGPLTLEETVRTVLQIAGGLAEAHAQGIVHRDIKPANIFITSRGEAKIMDFGLAKLAGQNRMTRKGSTVGTVAYMSPEQIQGGEVDARSDLFALGAVVYEMVTGEQPFRGDHEAAVMYAIVNVDPESPRDLNPDIPDGLQSIILKLLEKQPARRYQTAEDARSDLEHGMVHKESPARVSLRTWNPAVKKIVAAVGIVVLGFFISRFIVQRFFVHSNDEAPWRIGILPFQRLTQRPEVADWPMVIQMMMVDQLNGVEDLRIIDPFTLNNIVASAGTAGIQTIASVRQTGASYVMNGTVEFLDSTHILRTTLTDASDGSVKLSDVQSFKSEGDLPRAVQNISGQVLNYFQIRILSEGGGMENDLQPWLNHRTKKLDAIKAFLLGTQFTRRMQPGSEQYFRKAIELDSTFITPRTWLISGLVYRGHLEEARRHQAFLMRNLFTAGPFEQALIRWTGALIAGNVMAQIQSLGEALDYSPHNNVLLYLLADLKYSEGDFAGAAGTIRPAVESGWTFQPASLLLGTCLFRMRSLSESRAILERSLKLEPLLPESYGILAVLALHDGDQQVSVTYVREFTVRAQTRGWRQDSIDAFLAGNFSSLEMYEPASLYYAKALSTNRKRTEYYLGFGRSLFNLGDLLKAKEAADQALILDSTSIQLQDLLGRICDAKRDTPAALRHYGKFLSKDSTSVQSTDIRRRVRELTPY